MTTPETPESNAGPRGALYLVRAYGRGYFKINDTRFDSAVLLCTNRAPRPSSASDVEALTRAALEEVFGLEPELVLLGTGARQHFPPQALYAEFAQRRIALECMSTPAAIRTYNLLAEDGRQVVALLAPTES